MSVEDIDATRRRIEELTVEHRDLDAAIVSMTEGIYVDELQVRRFKKRKLQIRDLIARLESSLIPDMDA